MTSKKQEIKPKPKPKPKVEVKAEAKDATFINLNQIDFK